MVLRQSPPQKVNSETIGSLVQHRWYALGETTIGELTEELKNREDIPVVAVVNGQNALLGILSTNHLLFAIGRPYGWEVYHKRSILEWMEPVQSLDQGAPLSLIAEHLWADQESPAAGYYAVVGAQNTFLGLFSQQDLVAYLSKQTRRDLRLAQELQGQLVESHWERTSDRVASEGYCEMFKGVGGDFLVVRAVRPGWWFGCLCDVSGKGVAASLVTTLLWGLLEALDLTQPLEITVGRINQAMVRAFRFDRFVSGFFWTYSEEDGRLRFADMGHSHELFWVGGQCLAAEDSPNLPLGIDEDLEVCVGERLLAPGEGLFVYSDGVVENVWITKQDFPVHATVAELLGSPGATYPAAVIAGVRDHLALFRRAFPAHDDMSLVWFQRSPTA